jgi:RNA polymerase sigma-70 factor (ECF subfamily)
MPDAAATALEALLTNRTSALLRTAFLLTGDPEAARDLLQSALERVTRRLGTLRDPQAVEAYVRATMASTAANQRRRFWHREAPTAQLPERPSYGDHAVDIRLTVMAALRALPANQRAVIVMRFYEDLSEAQTAQALGIPVGTVKSRTSRALVALRASGLSIVEDGSRT